VSMEVIIQLFPCKTDTIKPSCFIHSEPVLLLNLESEKTTNLFVLTGKKCFVTRIYDPYGCREKTSGQSERSEFIWIMAKKRPTRKEFLKKPDEFLTLSARASAFIRDHSQAFTYLGMAAVAAVLVYLGVHTYLGYVNEKGLSAYNTAYYALLKNLKPDVNQADLKQSVELFEKVKDDYGLSKVSDLALPELAYLKFLEGKYDEAIVLYKKFLAEFSDGTSYQSLTGLSLAACYEAKGEVNQAIESLKRIVAGPDDHFKEQAMLSLARLYRLDQQQGKSKEILQEFVEKFKSSPFLPAAKARLSEFQE
jgi:outer membrane protein assembly factor BamD (BamD/ComL family)